MARVRDREVGLSFVGLTKTVREMVQAFAAWNGHVTGEFPAHDQLCGKPWRWRMLLSGSEAG